MELKFHTFLSNFLKKGENIENSLTNNIQTSNNLEGSSLFDRFIKEIMVYSETPPTNLTEMRKNMRYTKYKGILFEIFCKKYFTQILNVDNVWRIEECPLNILNSLSLTKKDYGIDLIMQIGANFFPIQCKFKSPVKLPLSKELKYHYKSVTWGDLSTYYSLCATTGPWEKLIVFTNTMYINRKGKKNEKDWSVCYQKLNQLTHDDFIKILNINNKEEKTGKTLQELYEESNKIEDNYNSLNMDIKKRKRPIYDDEEIQEELRQKRIKYFNQTMIRVDKK